MENHMHTHKSKMISSIVKHECAAYLQKDSVRSLEHDSKQQV